MIRNPEELTTAIKSAVDKRAVVVSHLMLASVIIVHTLLWPTLKPFERNIAIVLSIAIVMLILFRFFDLAKINKHPLIYTIIYEVLTFAGISFLTEPATPYVAIAFAVMIFSNLYYGAKGVYITIAVFGAATVTKYFFLSSIRELSTENLLDIFAAFFVFAAICLIFINVQKVYDWDRTRLKTIIREATIGQKRLRTLINSMTESVLVLDRNGVVRLYNAAALALFDTNSSLEDKRPADFAKFEDEKGKPLTLDELLPEGANPVARNDIKLRYTKEDTAALSLTITPLRTSFGQGDSYTGYILTLRDITREKSLEEERNEFISVISHELRTPVTVTEASLSNALMMHDKFGGSEEVKKTIVTAHDQAIFLANMLNDLSTFARAEKGTLELKLEEINPTELVKQIEVDYHNEAEVKGLHVTSSILEGTPTSLVSNRLYIREILQNFTTNAIKYSDSGTITITVGPNQKGGVRYSVTDQGIGISTSDQKKVFNKFYRSEDFRTRSSNGTGLGLYIVRKLTKLIKAEITMTSELGKGSTFSLDVPDLKAELAAHPHSASAEEAAAHVAAEINAAPLANQDDDGIKLTVSNEEGEEDTAEMEQTLAAVVEEPPAKEPEAPKDNHAKSFHL